MTILNELPVLGAMIAAAIFMAIVIFVSVEDALKH